MPANERWFGYRPLPERIYVDTSVFIAYLTEADTYHFECVAFLDDIAASTTTVYTSSLMPVEFIHVVTRPRFRNHLPEEWQTRFNLNNWNSSSDVRREYISQCFRTLDRLLNEFSTWIEVEVDSEYRRFGREYMSEYNLDAEDAIHLAVALSFDIDDIASLDGDFRSVPGINLWNCAAREHASAADT